MHTHHPRCLNVWGSLTELPHFYYTATVSVCQPLNRVRGYTGTSMFCGTNCIKHIFCAFSRAVRGSERNLIYSLVYI